METSRTTRPISIGALAKSFTKKLRLRRSDLGAGDGGGGIGGLRFRRSDAGAGDGGGIGGGEDGGINKLKLSKTFNGTTTIVFEPVTENGESEPAKPKIVPGNHEAMESLLANLFASISAVKASYAQLQVAQSPYDPDGIQSADQAVVSQLKRISELKHSFLKNQIQGYQQRAAQTMLEAQIQEQQSLVRTYQITTGKLENDVTQKEAEITSLRSQLMESNRQSHALESSLHPGRYLDPLDGVHISTLSPSHFLAALRHTVKSIRAFAKELRQEMELAKWDIAAVSMAIHPGVDCYTPGGHSFSLESYVCKKMFSNFQHRDFGLCAFSECHSWDRTRFFEEFSELKLMKPNEFLNHIDKFCRAKYLGLLHPKMDMAFFGNQDQRVAVSLGPGFPVSRLFKGFAEMARRVWLLHCLFLSFEEQDRSIFQARKGCRYSEVYMESVVSDIDLSGATLTVGFTVVPGFQIGRTVLQCKVYPQSLNP